MHKKKKIDTVLGTVHIHAHEGTILNFIHLMYDK